MRLLNLLVCSAGLLSFLQPQILRAADEKAALEKTRQELRAKGFKTDVSDFNFSATSDEFTRSAAINAANPRSWHSANAFYGGGLFSDLNLHSMIKTNTALVVWKLDSIGTPGVEPRATWEAMREMFDANGDKLDAVGQSLSTGKYGFDLNAKAGSSMLLPHLAVFKTVTQAFAGRAMLDLREGRPVSAWSNVVAATRIATHWRVEPVDISHSVRCAVATIAADAVWQVLQTNGWTDEQLAELQKEWESVDWFAGFPEMVAFQGASAAQLCQMERTNSEGLNLPIGQALRHPTEAVQNLKYYEQRREYLAHGSYEDEKALLQFYFDRQQDMVRALRCKTWVEMRQFASDTNMPSLQQKVPSTVRSRLNMMAMARTATAAVDGAPRTVIGRAAETEARRRLVVTALALERFRLKNKIYPEKLSQLAPSFIANEPLDFCDGKPLRYQRDGERFVLYSVGLDCSDDGGVAPVKSRRPDFTSRTNKVAAKEDLVWLIAASEKDIVEKNHNDALAERGRSEALQKEWAERKKKQEIQWRELRPKLARAYADQKPRKLDDPDFDGERLSKRLRNDAVLGNAEVDLYQLLTLRRVQSDYEPESVAFEVPINYDVFNHLNCELLLIVDSPDLGEPHMCVRAKNGNCLFLWDTTYSPPGQHFLQVELSYYRKDHDGMNSLHGPLMMVETTNLCEFDRGYSEAVNGEAIFWAKLAEPKGECSIELKNAAGEHIKTLTGSTTNGEIRIKWDWLNEQGKRDTNETINTFYTITLPESGRTQTLRGP